MEEKIIDQKQEESSEAKVVKEQWIQFTAVVNHISAAKFIEAVTGAINTGVEKLNILLSTPGGTVMHGKTVYNFLRSLPVDIEVYNIGQVDSVGGVMFLAADKRFAVANSSFLIHGVNLQSPGAISMTEKIVQEKLDGLKQDRASISMIYAERTDISLGDFEKMMLDGITISVDEAKKFGIIDDIVAPKVPKGSSVISIVDVIK